MSEQKAVELMNSVLTSGDEETIVESTAQLLNEFYSGFAVGNLRGLLLSPNDRIAEAGAFIASELGIEAKPVLSDAVTLCATRQRQCDLTFWM